MQFIYKEPKVTALAELTLRLQKLYSRKFGSKDIVHIIQESGKVSGRAERVKREGEVTFHQWLVRIGCSVDTVFRLATVDAEVTSC